MTPRALVIVDTRYVTPPRGEEPYYEITAAPDLADDAHRTVLLTRDTLIATQAMQAEGSESRVALTWRTGKRSDGRRCLVLDQYTPV